MVSFGMSHLQPCGRSHRRHDFHLTQLAPKVLSCKGRLRSRICRTSDVLLDTWRGRVENAQMTLRMCASEGPGFKPYIKHFMMLSSQACAGFSLPQFHNFNKLRNQKVLIERTVIGQILDAHAAGQARAANSGMQASNAGPREENWAAYLRRRACCYQQQAHEKGGHFVAVP